MKKFLQEKSKITLPMFIHRNDMYSMFESTWYGWKTKVDEIIASEQIEVKKSLVNVTEIEDKKIIK
mgnify:CR=1 FL=1